MKKYLPLIIGVTAVALIITVYFLPPTQEKINSWLLTRKPWMLTYKSAKHHGSKYDTSYFFAKPDSAMVLEFDKNGFVLFLERNRMDSVAFFWKMEKDELKLVRIDSSITYTFDVGLNKLTLFYFGYLNTMGPDRDMLYYSFDHGNGNYKKETTKMIDRHD